MRRVLAATVLLALCVTPLKADENLAQAVSDDYEAALADLFVYFHSHPELSFREYETATRLAEELRAAGVEVTEEGFGILTAEVVALAHDHCGGRVVSMLEGGYDLKALSASVDVHVEGLCNSPDSG